MVIQSLNYVYYYSKIVDKFCQELFCFKKNWDEKERYVEDNTLSVHIARIRKKLGLYHGKPYIDTVKGIGYRWNIKVLEINCNKERQ